MANLSKNREEYKQRRAQLIELTNIARKIRETEGEEGKPLNFYIVNNIYQQQRPGVYNTFQEWKRQNKTIKKGEKGFPIWGQPVSSKGKAEAQQAADDSEMQYFPLCYLFHESQVVDQKAEAEA